MSTMDHAAAHERIEDLVLEPARLRELGSSEMPEDVALRAHVATCPTCRADLQGWERLQGRLAGALSPSIDEARAATRSIEVPSSIRTAVVAAARATGSRERPQPVPARSAATLPRRPVVAWLAVAASLVVLAGAAILTFDQVGRRESAEADARALSSVVAAVDRVLQAPRHWVVPLSTPAGGSGGSISWSSQDLVVLTTALEPPPAGQRYVCWLLEGGADASASVVGTMFFAGRTAYWVGSLDEWATFRIGPNTRFAVTLEGQAITDFTGPVYLSADLGS